MRGGKRTGVAALLIVAVAGAAGCGSSPAATVSPPARMQRIGHSPVPSVVLTPTGARRIGIQTSPVVAVQVSSSMTVIPYAALLYEPDGSTAVYASTAPLVYTRRLITVDHIAGNQVYVSQGLTPGMNVVTVGAEELLGVQNGVGVET